MSARRRLTCLGYRRRAYTADAYRAISVLFYFLPYLRVFGFSLPLSFLPEIMVAREANWLKWPLAPGSGHRASADAL